MLVTYIITLIKIIHLSIYNMLHYYYYYYYYISKKLLL